MTVKLPNGWANAKLIDVADILDFEREPINSSERNFRIEGKQESQLYAYYGATGQVGWIDGYRSEGQRILLGEDGAPFLDSSKDKAYLVNGRFWVNNHAHVLQGADGLIDNRFLCYQLNMVDYQPFVSGSTRLKLTNSAMKQIPLVLAPAKEQTRIVEKLEELLSELDAGVAELKAAQKKLVQYRQSLLKVAVEGALSAEWRKTHQPEETGAQLLERILKQRRANWEAKQLAKFQQQGKTPPKGWQDKYPEPVKPDTSDLPELPEGWFYCHLEALIQSDKTGTKTGPFGSLLKKHEHKKTGVPVIGIENIDRMKFISGSKIHISPEKAEELKDYDLLPGDVVISRSGTVGEVCVIPDDLGLARFSTNIMRVRLESQVIDPKFFCLLLNGSPYVLSQIRELCSGSTRDFLNTEILKTLIFPVPPSLEQTAILELLKLNLDGVEAQNHALRTSLKQSAAQRKNLLKVAFSGQLVSQDPNDEPASMLLERIRAERAAQALNGKLRKRSTANA